LVADPEITLPIVWTDETGNGIKIWGINHTEVPLVRYSLVINGGHLLDHPEKAGVASFLAAMLKEGTVSKTPEELEEAIEMLGASIDVYGGTENITVNVNTLARNFEATLQLVEEILTQPRWDEEQFGLVKSRIINELKRNEANPNYLAAINYYKLIYPENSPLGTPASGTIKSVETITMDDLKNYYNTNLSPSVTKMHVAGDIQKDRVMKALGNLTETWEA
jgi:zinc protease